MSMYRAINCGNYVIRDFDPAWMRAERYDYCDSLNVIRKKRNGKNPLLQALQAIFRK